MDLVNLDNDVKRAYLEKRMLVSFGPGNNRFVVFCEFCKQRFNGTIRVSKTNKTNSVSVVGANFHHLDGNPKNDVLANLRLYCRKCHKNVHYWGIIQRWLEKNGKTVNELPDSRSLKPMTYRNYKT